VKRESQELENGESISVIEVALKEAQGMCFDGCMQENRSIAVLLK
jgi:hypothetical protein